MKHKITLMIIVLLIFAFGVWYYRSVNKEKFLPEEVVKDTVKIENNSTLAITTTMQLRSRAFENGKSIPSKYTCDGTNINPPLNFSNVPTNAKSLVLIMEDHDVPRNLRPDGVFDHWIVFNIPSDVRIIEEGERVKGLYGVTTNGKTEYTGPCPPDKEHNYTFSLYALDRELTLKAGSPKIEILNHMTTHIIAETKLVGNYERKR